MERSKETSRGRVQHELCACSDGLSAPQLPARRSTSERARVFSSGSEPADRAGSTRSARRPQRPRATEVTETRRCREPSAAGQHFWPPSRKVAWGKQVVRCTCAPTTMSHIGPITEEMNSRRGRTPFRSSLVPRDNEVSPAARAIPVVAWQCAGFFDHAISARVARSYTIPLEWMAFYTNLAAVTTTQACF